MTAFMKFVWHSHYITSFPLCKVFLTKKKRFCRVGFFYQVIKKSKIGQMQDTKLVYYIMEEFFDWRA